VLYYCSEHGQGGDVFVIMFEHEDKQNFQLSNFEIGSGFCLINPAADGMWANAVVLKSSSPCIQWVVANAAFVPTPFPDSVRKIHY
jgi:hypothetical protein